MNKDTAAKIFKSVIEGMNQPEPINQPHSHSYLHERFTRVVVRDALQACGVKFKLAEKFATEESGSPRKRFWRCYRILGLEMR